MSALGASLTDSMAQTRLWLDEHMQQPDQSISIESQVKATNNRSLGKTLVALGFFHGFRDVSRYSRLTAVTQSKHQCHQLPGTLAAA